MDKEMIDKSKIHFLVKFKAFKSWMIPKMMIIVFVLRST
jgi:hypothetical protein